MVERRRRTRYGSETGLHGAVLVPVRWAQRRWPGVGSAIWRARRRLGPGRSPAEVLELALAAERNGGPPASLEALAARFPLYVTIDRDARELVVHRHLVPERRYRIACGRRGYETLPGRFRIKTKLTDPDWLVPDNPCFAEELRGTVVPSGHPANPIKERWLGVYPTVGIHGTTVIGWLGIGPSVGCVRMSVPDVNDLYERVPLGTPVFIA